MRRLLEEEQIDADAVGWLSAERHYQQVFEDPHESTNACFDSIGILEARPCFIEVKRSVGPIEARHIESKISGSLRGHADRSDRHPQFVVMRTVWDGLSVPLIATIARNYTEAGLAELTRMLEKRSREWAFDFEIWRWTVIASRCWTGSPLIPRQLATLLFSSRRSGWRRGREAPGQLSSIFVPSL